MKLKPGIIVTIILFSLSHSAESIKLGDSELILPVVSNADTGGLTADQQNQIFFDRQYANADLHKKLAFTTAGLLLASDIIGLIHFLDLQNQGHIYRDSIGFQEESQNSAVQTDEIKKVWQGNTSQTYRIVHGALIAATVISYTTTATIELSTTRMSSNPLKYSDTHLHKYLFLAHASLMAANVGLGFAESYALSQGKHNLVQGLGIAHIIIGFSAPVVIGASGLVFKLPWY